MYKGGTKREQHRGRLLIERSYSDATFPLILADTFVVLFVHSVSESRTSSFRTQKQIQAHKRERTPIAKSFINNENFPEVFLQFYAKSHKAILSHEKTSKSDRHHSLKTAN